MARLAILTLFMGQTRNRFLQYQTPRDIAEILAMAGRTEGCEGVEMRYPGDLADVPLAKAELARHNLGLAAINFASVRGDRWLRGAWSSSNPRERREAVDDFKRCIDIATALGAPRITNCPLNDGIDGCFELDFARAYDHAAECYAEIADHNPAFQICIEYKISEPRMRSLLGTAGETAAFCQLVNRDNLGVTLDLGHALFANENGAQSAALLAKAKRLFYVHLNDNDGRADWDLLPGAVHTWEMVEFLYTLRELGYDDWFTFDIVPKEQDPIEFFATAARLTRRLEAISRRIDRAKMASLQADKNPARTLDYLHTLI
ncbi:MAG: sugar phosphate isomerase/epimerase [Betaproteobacteria bacterium]|jgi:xylose isomerase|nr:sugar phosphate isomerase/epimerase [Betaproteobacteria bacterium]MBK7079993.1 sugar phosphate isomerase/epimerase [Betaproteobacteria bacterium]MBK7592996.1 sugar phosphate isomerase/epimerase [Betaproteobacteria bacterium]MBK7743336.1 sugar phosphate isomerase/epimerase [Betaproteobacteria bacterium]MBK8688025.1 sugar phosphate isomerase/epimerase [Betaproteobacteria bacterium]